MVPLPVPHAHAPRHRRLCLDVRLQAADVLLLRRFVPGLLPCLDAAGALRPLGARQDVVEGVAGGVERALGEQELSDCDELIVGDRGKRADGPETWRGKERQGEHERGEGPAEGRPSAREDVV